jgi:hypothetical protein
MQNFAYFDSLRLIIRFGNSPLTIPAGFLTISAPNLVEAKLTSMRFNGFELATSP